MNTTKVYMDGDSQVICIPNEYRYEEKELYISKIGDIMIMVPGSQLTQTLEIGASLISENFMEDGMPDEIPSIREEF